MAVSNRTRPEFTVDKNGKITTVHRLAEQNAKGGKSRLDGIGSRVTNKRNDGTPRTEILFSASETAKLLRESLKDQFQQEYPETKFSVAKSSGSAIQVTYTDGPPAEEVEAVAEMYASSTYNGRSYMREGQPVPVTEDGAEVRYGAEWTFVKREISDGARSQAEGELAGYLGKDVPASHIFVDTPDEVRAMNPDMGYADATVFQLVNIIATNNAKANK